AVSARPVHGGAVLVILRGRLPVEPLRNLPRGAPEHGAAPGLSAELPQRLPSAFKYGRFQDVAFRDATLVEVGREQIFAAELLDLGDVGHTHQPNLSAVGEL